MNNVLKTLQIKLLPEDNQKDILLGTFKKFNEACNFVSRIAWDNKISLQKLVYYDIRNKYSIISAANREPDSIYPATGSWATAF